MIKFLKFIGILFFIVAVFILSALCGYAYVVPTTYISLNANASISYSLNIYDIVIDSSSSNEAGEVIISYANFSNKKITEAIPETIDKLISDGYISKDNNSNVTITVTSSDKGKAERLVKKLQKSMQDYKSNKTDIKNVNVDIELKLKQ